MRHHKTTPSLSRKVGPRKALLRGLATSLVLNGKMKTTLPKAKAIQPIVEKYVTTSKKKNLANRRQLLKYFYEEKAVNILLDELGPKYKERPGGYTRIAKLGKRKGDDAEMALIEFV